MPPYWALLCHNIRHKLYGRALRHLPSISQSLFTVCLTTVNQHKLYSFTTFAYTLQFLNAPQFLAHYQHKQQTVVPYRYTLLSRCALKTQHTAPSPSTALSAIHRPPTLGALAMCLQKVVLILKVKESRNRPGVAQMVPGRLGLHIFKTLGTLRW